MSNFPIANTITLNSLPFHYRDWGGEGVPLVLLHGLASNSRIWDLIAPLLAEKHRVVALDQRGHGLSTKAGDDYSYQAMVGDLRAFVRAMSLENPVIVGHSWGGNVALAYGAWHPDEPRGLVFIDGGTFDVQGRLSWEEAREMLAPPPLAGMRLNDFKQRILSWAPEGMLSPEITEVVLANFRIDDEERIYPHLTRENHLRIIRAMWEQRPGELYPRVQCPVLVLAARWEGRDDPERLATKAEEVEKAERALARVEVVWLDETVHDVPLQRPQRAADLIGDFVARL